MSKSELQRACEEAGVTITSVHLHIDWSDDPKYPRDKWACTIHYKDKSETFDFFTGIGQRVCAFGVKPEGSRKWVKTSTGDVVFGDWQAIEKGFLVLKKEKGKVVGPSVADVLSCVLSDAGAMNTTFDEWCSDLGYDSDSLNALNTYLACQRNGVRVRKLLGYELMQSLQGKEH